MKNDVKTELARVQSELKGERLDSLQNELNDLHASITKSLAKVYVKDSFKTGFDECINLFKKYSMYPEAATIILRVLETARFNASFIHLQ